MQARIAQNNSPQGNEIILFVYAIKKLDYCLEIVARPTSAEMVLELMLLLSLSRAAIEEALNQVLGWQISPIEANRISVIPQ